MPEADTDAALSKAVRKIAMRATAKSGPRFAYAVLLEAAGAILAEGLPGPATLTITDMAQQAPTIIFAAALRHRARNPKLAAARG